MHEPEFQHSDSEQRESIEPNKAQGREVPNQPINPSLGTGTSLNQPILRNGRTLRVHSGPYTGERNDFFHGQKISKEEYKELRKIHRKRGSRLNHETGKYEVIFPCNPKKTFQDYMFLGTTEKKPEFFKIEIDQTALDVSMDRTTRKYKNAFKDPKLGQRIENELKNGLFDSASYTLGYLIDYTKTQSPNAAIIQGTLLFLEASSGVKFLTMGVRYMFNYGARMGRVVRPMLRMSNNLYIAKYHAEQGNNWQNVDCYIEAGFDDYLEKSGKIRKPLPPSHERLNPYLGKNIAHLKKRRADYNKLKSEIAALCYNPRKNKGANITLDDVFDKFDADRLFLADNRQGLVQDQGYIDDSPLEIMKQIASDLNPEHSSAIGSGALYANYRMFILKYLGDAMGRDFTMHRRYLRRQFFDALPRTPDKKTKKKILKSMDKLISKIDAKKLLEFAFREELARGEVQWVRGKLRKTI